MSNIMKLLKVVHIVVVVLWVEDIF